MKLILFTFSFLASTYLITAQSLTAKVVDKSNKPIAFASISTENQNGVVTNEEGQFTIDIEGIKTLTISCLGYETITPLIDDINANDNIIVLDAAINVLDQVYISNKKIDADTLIARVKANIRSNYAQNLVMHNFFIRHSNKFRFTNVDFNLSKASGFRKKQLRPINKSLDSLSESITTNNSNFYSDFKGNLYVNTLFSDTKPKDTLQLLPKLTNIKVVNIFDSKNDFSIEKIQDKAKNIVLSYLNRNNTYKVKSGLFKVTDSLSFKDIEETLKDSIKTKKVKTLKANVIGSLIMTNLEYGFYFTEVFNSKLYAYKLEISNYVDDKLIHVVGFSPKRAKAKYSGKIYISDEDYGVLKINYAFAEGKRGQHLNLRLVLGVKFSQSTHSVSVLYKKIDGFYYPHYFKSEEISSFYINRPFKFIENSKEKNKVTFNVKLEGTHYEKEEFLISRTSKIDLNTLTTVKEKEQVPVIKLDQYNANEWKNQNIITPTEEMKNFKSAN